MRGRILDAARKAFADRSVESVSIQAIADSLGYSKGTILKYYPTKILLSLAVKQQELEQVTRQLQDIRARTPDPTERLQRVMEAYIAYWLKNPDDFRSLFSMSGTLDDRKLADGTYFGESEIAKRALGVFITSTSEFLIAQGIKPPGAMVRRLALVLLSAAHGVISLPLGTPSMRLMTDTSLTGRILIKSVIDAWVAKIKALHRKRSTITIDAFA